MSEYTEEELALLSDEEREALLDEGDDDDGEEAGADEPDPAVADDDGEGEAADDRQEGEDDGADDGDDGADDGADDGGNDDGEDGAAEDDGQQQEDDGEGEDGGEEAADGDDEGAQQPNFSVESRLPEDWQQQMDEVTRKQKALRNQYDDGEIDDTEYDKEWESLRQEEKRLDRIYTKAEFAAEQHEKELENQWKADVRAFYKDYPQFLPTDPDPEKNENPLYDAMDKQVVKIATANPNLTNKQVLDKALARFPEHVRQKAGADTGKDEGKREGKPNRQRREVPTTLRKVPAATTTETDDGGKFAYLDKLDPMALEKELAKMSESEREAYMAQ